MNLLNKFTNPANNGLSTFNLKRQWVTSYELKATSYELRDTSYKLRDTCFKMRDTSYDIRSEIYSSCHRSPVPVRYSDRVEWLSNAESYRILIGIICPGWFVSADERAVYRKIISRCMRDYQVYCTEAVVCTSFYFSRCGVPLQWRKKLCIQDSLSVRIVWAWFWPLLNLVGQYL